MRKGILSQSANAQFQIDDLNDNTAMRGINKLKSLLNQLVCLLVLR
jgi:hypothetical protein